MRYNFRKKGDGGSFWQQDRELADDRAAQAEALQFAATLIREGACADDDGVELSVEVGDSDGRLLFAIRIRTTGMHRRLGSADEHAHDGESEAHPS